MQIILIIIAIILSFFATSVMSYISMATPIGPWIAPTLVLTATILFKLVRPAFYETSLALVTCAGSVGGIIATAVAFSFPTLFFLDPDFFASLMVRPFLFATLLGTLCFTAGWFGIWIANLLENRLIIEEQLSFPVGTMINRMIGVHHHIRKAYQMSIGFVLSCIFACLQDGYVKLLPVIPKSIDLVACYSYRVFTIPLVRFDISPLFWAIGFVTGHVIAVPLAVGAVARICIAGPIHQTFFTFLGATEFNFAFCSGIVLYATLMSMVTNMRKWIMAAREHQTTNAWHTVVSTFSLHHSAELGMVTLVAFLFLSSVQFSFSTSCYLLVLTFIFTRQVAFIAGRIGLAPLGMFATFVMFPALFIFRLTSLHIVIIAAFVEICAGVTADILFGRKIGYLGTIDTQLIKKFQYLGLVTSSLCIGIIVWLLIQKFSLGSPELFASKAQSRALLVHAVHDVNYFAIIPGFLFALLLQYTGINSALVLGGILMPLSVSMGLIAGGLLTLFVKQKEEWYPFWSGIFAAQSLWMLFKAVL